jgi:hypothetical protein
MSGIFTARQWPRSTMDTCLPAGRV